MLNVIVCVFLGHKYYPVGTTGEHAVTGDVLPVVRCQRCQKVALDTSGYRGVAE